MRSPWPPRWHKERAMGAKFACGRIEATFQDILGLFDRLETPLIARFDEVDGAGSAIERLLHEMARPRPGSAKMCESLLYECLIGMLRALCDNGECRLPWLARLEHPRLSPVIAAMLDRPDRPYTLDDFANLAGMSRSNFAAKFTKTFERPPMDFLREIRLRKAAELLLDHSLPIETVAGRVGYRSRSYFCSAFKGFFGLDPASYRRAIGN